MYKQMQSSEILQFSVLILLYRETETNGQVCREHKNTQNLDSSLYPCVQVFPF
jgi:hypothetical protein